MSNLPVVCIVGRPNVGKSSLFNRILGRRAAVVSDREGVTRDRHYQEAQWQGAKFTLVDTGGFMTDDQIDVLAESVREQIFTAINEADLILFLVDVRVGATTLDQQFAKLILKTEKNVILVANKSEEATDRAEGWAFLQLGMGTPRTVSALTGYAVLSLLDEIVSLLPKKEKAKQEQTHISFAILGRPNVGKSTLLNKLLGEDRVVVSEIPGTTRDSIDCHFKYKGTYFKVTDTAGLRKKAKVAKQRDEVEIFSNMRTMESIRRSDIVVLLLDATRGFEIQDLRIIADIRKAGKGLILAINKWDILENKDSKSFDLIIKEIRKKDPLFEWVPVMSISALEGLRVHRLMQEIQTVHANCKRVIGRERVAETFKAAIAKNPHHARSGHSVPLRRACQILTNPPVITIETPYPDLVDEAYKRYLLKTFFEEFGLQGAPLKLNFDRSLRLRSDEDLLYYQEEKAIEG
ncbi:MAG: ribosome biogenesis GTPase Der [Fibromonadaceae bacterium]|jgi:GTP-binding protein|nr:ribosome biogenesis GTPase Der [Fibromonadaceae bacterium]